VETTIDRKRWAILRNSLRYAIVGGVAVLLLFSDIAVAKQNSKLGDNPIISNNSPDRAATNSPLSSATVVENLGSKDASLQKSILNNLSHSSSDRKYKQAMRVFEICELIPLQECTVLEIVSMLPPYLDYVGNFGFLEDNEDHLNSRSSNATPAPIYFDANNRIYR
jgi:hypothetical protein